MSPGAEYNGALRGFGNVDKIPTEVFPVSFVHFALNDQIFTYSKNKSSADPFSLDGLVCNRSAGFVHVRSTGLLGFCALFSGLWEVPCPLGFASSGGIGWKHP